MAKKKVKSKTRARKSAVGKKRTRVRQKPKRAPAKRAVARRAPTRRDRARGARLQRVVVTAFAKKTIDELDLVPHAKAGAEALLKEHGASIVFTSGRRTVKQQADAMAPHVVNDRQWIVGVYKDKEVANALQKWVDDHPEAKTAKQIGAGLEAVINSWPAETQLKLSRHLTGAAFDVNPVAGEAGAKIKKSIKALADLDDFLEKEGNDVVWHAQFK